MPKKGRKGKKLGVNKISKGFCISCGASSSSKFRSAPEKWEAFYQYRNDERNEKKKRVCTRCYIRLRKLDCSASTTQDGKSDCAADLPTKGGIIVKPSPIGGNGLFATRDFEKGEYVTEYGGRILPSDETAGKDTSYFRVIGIDKRNGIIDGKYNFGDAMGRYINTPQKRQHPNCTWGKFNPETQTTTIKTNKVVKCGQEFMIRYSSHIRRILHSTGKKGRPPKK